MKKIKSYIVRDIMGETVLVPADETAQEFNGMIELSESAAFIWEHIEESANFGQLVDMILQEYDVDRQTAAADASTFVMQLLQQGMIKPSGTDW